MIYLSHPYMLYSTYSTANIFLHVMIQNHLFINETQFDFTKFHRLVKRGKLMDQANLMKYQIFQKISEHDKMEKVEM